MTDADRTIEVRGERFHPVEAQRLAAGVMAMADKLDQESDHETVIYEDDQETALFGGRAWSAPELRELAGELATMEPVGDRPANPRLAPPAPVRIPGDITVFAAAPAREVDLQPGSALRGSGCRPRTPHREARPRSLA
jgi:hypothetical protein